MNRRVSCSQGEQQALQIAREAFAGGLLLEYGEPWPGCTSCAAGVDIE